MFAQAGGAPASGGGVGDGDSAAAVAGGPEVVADGGLVAPMNAVAVVLPPAAGAVGELPHAVKVRHTAKSKPPLTVTAELAIAGPYLTSCRRLMSAVYDERWALSLVSKPHRAYVIIVADEAYVVSCSGVAEPPRVSGEDSCARWKDIV